MYKSNCLHKGPNIIQMIRIWKFRYIIIICTCWDNILLFTNCTRTQISLKQFVHLQKITIWTKCQNIVKLICKDNNKRQLEFCQTFRNSWFWLFGNFLMVMSIRNRFCNILDSVLKNCKFLRIWNILHLQLNFQI